MFHIYMHNTRTNKRGADWGKAFNDYETAKAYLRAIYQGTPDKHTVSVWQINGNKKQVCYMDII